MTKISYYYITEYLDEIPAHKSTLEDAAHFLQTGCFDRETKEPDEYWADDLPLAQPGDIIELETLTVLCDATATRRTLDDGAAAWTFDPPIPDDADFLAIRWGPGLGWSGETICNPKLKTFQVDFAEAACEMCNSDDVIEDVVLCRTGKCQARFDVIDGVPTLTICDDKADG